MHQRSRLYLVLRVQLHRDSCGMIDKFAVHVQSQPPSLLAHLGFSHSIVGLHRSSTLYSGDAQHAMHLTRSPARSGTGTPLPRSAACCLAATARRAGR